jgi:hypothetical protein
MACITKTVTVDVETDVDVELDEGEIRELISDEGLGVADLFSDAEIQEAAENTADWEGWLEKSIEEMGDFADAALAAHGYHKAPPAKPLSEQLSKAGAFAIVEALQASGHSMMFLADEIMRRLPIAQREEVVAEWNAANETAIREKVKAEMIAKLFD